MNRRSMIGRALGALAVPFVAGATPKRATFVPPEHWTYHAYGPGSQSRGHAWLGWFDDAEGRVAAYLDTNRIVWIWRTSNLPLVACGELAC